MRPGVTEASRGKNGRRGGVGGDCIQYNLRASYCFPGWKRPALTSHFPGRTLLRGNAQGVMGPQCWFHRNRHELSPPHREEAVLPDTAERCALHSLVPS